MNNKDIIIGNMCICTGSVHMDIPAGGKHVRQVTIFLRNFTNTPSVTASVVSSNGNGTIFGLYNVTIVGSLGQTEIKFTATNVQSGVPSDFDYRCSYVVTGEI